jgi:LPXTG-motif cell wall-anchored protein
MAREKGGLRPSKRISAALVMSLATAMVIAVAVPSRASAPGPYSGFATGGVVHLDALTAGGTTTTNGTRLANVDVGLSNAATDSQGTKALLNEYARPIVPPDAVGKKAVGEGSLAEVGLGVDPKTVAQLQTIVSEAKTSDGHVTDDQDNLNIPGAPLIWADGLHTNAVANWNPDTCVIGEPISAGFTRLLNADLVDMGASDNTDGSFKQALASVGSVNSHSFTQLYPGAGDGLGLAGYAATNAFDVTLFKGDPANEITIHVLPAHLLVKADGTPGGAKVDYDAPLVTITQAGQEIFRLLPKDNPGPIDIQIPPGAGDSGSDMLLRLKLGTLLPLASETGPNIKSKTKADGTAASASVNILELTLLDVPEVPLRGLTLGIGHLEAAAQVPAGGIDCPIPVTKTPSQSTVQSGDTFTTTIKIDNPFVCPLENVSLTDVITTEGAATFQVLSASPDADSPSLPTASGLTGPTTVKWNNLGTIAPGASKSVTVTLKAGGGAGKIKDTATAAGAVSNCKPAPGSSSTEVTGITNVKVPVTGVGTLQVPETTVLGVTKLPKTGLNDGTLTIVGMLMLLAAATGGSVLRRRRQSHSNA